jgi:hypothetical protein
MADRGAMSQTATAGDLVPVIDPAIVTTPEPTDPLAPVDDAFAEQRARRQTQREDGVTQSIEQAGEQLEQGEINGTPVDGANDKNTVGKTDSDEDVAEGEFGEKPAVTGPEDDKTFDHDDSEIKFDNMTMTEIDMELDQFEAGEQQLEQLSEQVRMLSESAIAIESFGNNPTAMAIMQTTGLLDSTALQSMALESVNFTAGHEPESQMALEAIGDKIKDTATAWAAKVVSVVKTGTEKLLTLLEKMWTGVSGAASKLASGTWNAAKAATAKVKAHPYATAAACVAAVAVVGGIVAMVATGTPAPGAKIDVMKAFMKKVAASFSAVKWPFGKVGASVSENGMKLIPQMGGQAGVFNVADTKTIKELGWSQSAVKALLGQLNRAWDGVKKGLGALGTRTLKLVGEGFKLHDDFVSKPAAAAGDAAGNAVMRGLRARNVGPGKTLIAGFYAKYVTEQAYKGAIYTLIGGLYKLCRGVVVGTFRLLMKTLNALKTMVTGGGEPATA